MTRLSEAKDILRRFNPSANEASIENTLREVLLMLFSGDVKLQLAKFIAQGFSVEDSNRGCWKEEDICSDGLCSGCRDERQETMREAREVIDLITMGLVNEEETEAERIAVNGSIEEEEV